MVRNGHGKMLVGNMAEMGPGRVTTFFLPQKPLSNRGDPRQHGNLSIFLLFGGGSQSPLAPGPSGAIWSHSLGPHRARTLCCDCLHEYVDADDIHYTGEVVAEHAQRHFGGDLGQRLA